MEVNPNPRALTLSALTSRWRLTLTPFFDLESLTLTLSLESLSPNPGVLTLEPSMSSVGVCFSSPRFWAGGGLLRAGENPMMSGMCVCFFPALVFGLAEASIALERSCGFAVVCVCGFFWGALHACAH